MLRSFAQHREDIILHRALRHIDAGFYIDVGAYLPVEYSATKLFYDAGWTGINLEPCRSWFQELAAARPRDINLPVAASDQQGECEFYQVTDPGKGPHSTCVGTVADQLRNYGMRADTYRVPTQRLDSICAKHAPAEIHFLKIDVEGAERQVLLGADFGKHRPWIVVIEGYDLENALVADAWEPILFAAEYRYGMTHAKNRFYWAAEHSELAAALSVPFDEYETREACDERAAAQREIGSLREGVARSIEEAAGLRQEVIRLEQEAAGLRQEATEATRLRREAARWRQDIIRLEEEIRAIKASTSWRMTSPLRSLGGRLRQVSRAEG